MSEVETASVVSRTPSPTDRGWAWIVLLASLVLQALSMGVMLSVGVYIVEWKSSFGGRLSAVAWVGSLCAGVVFLTAPIGSVLCNSFGHRFVIFVGSIIAACGLVISAFAPNIYVLYGSFGLITGFGMSCMYNPAVVVVGFYFRKYQALAMGLSSTGGGLGPMLLAPFMRVLIEHYGWRGSLLLVAGITLHGTVAGALMFPLRPSASTGPQRTAKRTKLKEIADVKLLKDVNMWLVIINHTLWCTGSFTFFILVVDYATETGMSKDSAAWVVAVTSLCNLLAKVVVSVLTNAIPGLKPIYIYMVSCSLTGVSLLLFPLWESAVGFFVLAACFGLWFGSILGTLAITTVHIFGLERSTSAFCYSVIGDGLGALIGPTVAGLVFEATSRSYTVPFIFGGTCMVLSGLVVGLVILYGRCKQSSVRVPKSDIQVDGHLL